MTHTKSLEIHKEPQELIPRENYCCFKKSTFAVKKGENILPSIYVLLRTLFKTLAAAKQYIAV